MSGPKTLFIYHGGCPDGFGSAFAAWLLKGDEFEYLPAYYEKSTPIPDGRDIVLADFCFPKEQLLALMARSKSVTVLDHHDSAAPYVPKMLAMGMIQGVFDKSRSGALITWEYFWKHKAPWLIEAISSRDTWQWNYYCDREIVAALDALDFDFKQWEDFLNKGRDSAVIKGKVILEAHRANMKKMLGFGKGLEACIDGHWVPAINMPYLFASESGNELAKGAPFAAVFSDVPTGRKWSLRSDTDGLNVEKIAAKYGGGGHVNASSFTLPWGAFDQVEVRPAQK